MATQGPLGGSTFTNEPIPGSVPWNNPQGATTSDNDYANCLIALLDESTGGLRAGGFGFSIPGGSTINGIVVEVERSAGLGVGDIIDLSARTVKGGVVGGSDLASLTVFPTTDAYITYGGSTELWGRTWTPADINGSTFGFEFVAQNTSGISDNPRVDHIRITVHYTPGGSTAPLMMLMGVGA